MINKNVINQRVIVMIILSVLSSNHAENQSSYKILLTQNTEPQFAEFEVDVPALREFTICTWLRVQDLHENRAIFAYKGADEILLSLWLESDGAAIRVMIAGEVMAAIPAQFTIDEWRHVCLTYQSNVGAWAAFLDGKMIMCNASQSIYGSILPKGGSWLIGYGSRENGIAGFVGQIYGTHLYLKSTLTHEKRSTESNTMNPILSHMFPKKEPKPREKSQKNWKFASNINYNNPVRQINAPDGIEYEMDFISSNSKKHIPEKLLQTVHKKNKVNNLEDIIKNKMWNVVNKAGLEGRFKKHNNRLELSGSDTNDLPTLSLFETPPPPETVKMTEVKQNDFLTAKEEMENYPVFNVTMLTIPLKTQTVYMNNMENEVYEKPPPIQKQNDVFGQWINSNFATSVLDHVKKNKINTKVLIPPTIPLIQISSSYPYPTNMIKNKYVKRETMRPKNINVQILPFSLRDDILNYHAQTRPVNVEIFSRGEPKTRRPTITLSNSEEGFTRSLLKPRPFTSASKLYDTHRTKKARNMLEILPHLFNTNNLLKYSQASSGLNEDDYSEYEMSYSNYTNLSNQYQSLFNSTNKEIYDIESDNDMEDSILNLQKKYPYYISNNKKVCDTEGKSTTLDNLIGTQVSTYRLFDPVMEASNGNYQDKQRTTHQLNDFDKPVKIGNALNEEFFIGENEYDKNKGFIGGDDRIPDINKYRSDIDDTNDDDVPPSLLPRICTSQMLNLPYQNIEGYRSSGYYFIELSFKKCSLRDLEYNSKHQVLISWERTPLRLFGGAQTQRTKKICN